LSSPAWIPWFVARWLARHWPAVYQFVAFGRWNINTAEHWDQAWARHSQGGFRASTELPSVRERLVELVPPDSVVLDVGCGAGELLETLREAKRAQGYGVDISSVAVATTREKGFEAQVSRLPAIPFQSHFFQTVVCTETLEHVTDVTGSLKEIARVLRPDGLFVVTVPDGSVDLESAHVHRFKESRLVALLSRQFEDINVERHVNGPEFTLLASSHKRRH